MTARSHDLAAFTLLNLVFVNFRVDGMSFATAAVGFGACFLGGLAPDLDQPTAKMWNSLPAGSIIGRVIGPILGSHRMISHSALGMWLVGKLLARFLTGISSVVLVDMSVVWWCFMIGFVSHLFVDTFTKEGVPWLFPLPIRLGLPPFKFLRVVTGGFAEKSLFFPGMVILNIYLMYNHYAEYLDFVKRLS